MTTPTMILWGRQDTIYQAGMAEEYARRIPNSTVHIIEEAGHLPHEEQPEQVNKLPIDFLP